MTSDIECTIRSFLSRFIRNHEIKDDQDIFAAGFVNSMFAMQLVQFIEHQYGFAIESEDRGALLEHLRAAGLDGHPNVSYPRRLRGLTVAALDDGRRARGCRGDADDADNDSSLAHQAPVPLVPLNTAVPSPRRSEQASFAARPLADELHERLAAVGLGCTRLRIEAETEHGERHSSSGAVTVGRQAIGEALTKAMDAFDFIFTVTQNGIVKLDGSTATARFPIAE